MTLRKKYCQLAAAIQSIVEEEDAEKSQGMLNSVSVL